jgi:hypothetical protein
MGPGCRSSEGWRRQTGHKETTSTHGFSLGHGEADAAATKHGRRGLGRLLADRRRRVEARRGGEEEESRRGTGRRRHEVGGGEGSARGKPEVRVAASRVNGLPNDTRVWPRAKIDAVLRPSRMDYLFPKGPSSSFSTAGCPASLFTAYRRRDAIPRSSRPRHLLGHRGVVSDGLCRPPSSRCQTTAGND